MAKRKTKTRRFTVRVTDATYRTLRKEADRTGLGMTQVAGLWLELMKHQRVRDRVIGRIVWPPVGRSAR